MKGTNIKLAACGLLGIGLGALLYRAISKKYPNAKIPLVPNEPTLTLGDKSKDVEKLQQTLNRLIGVNVVEETGTYDQKTRNVVVNIFKDTKFLQDMDKGEIKVNFVRDLEKTLNNLRIERANDFKEILINNISKILKDD